MAQSKVKKFKKKKQVQPKRKSNGYAEVPNDLLYSAIVPASAVVVYMYMSLYKNDNGVEITHREIANALRMTEDEVEDSIQYLIQEGYIRRVN